MALAASRNNDPPDYTLLDDDEENGSEEAKHSYDPPDFTILDDDGRMYMPDDFTVGQEDNREDDDRDTSDISSGDREPSRASDSTNVDDPYDEDTKARISGIRPKDYTRMGVTIRHLTQLLNQVEARTKLLITLSDGKPDDYDTYRGAYGIEDTRGRLLRIKITHKDLASLIGSSRETVSLTLGDLKRVGLIDVNNDRKIIITNEKQLSQLT